MEPFSSLREKPAEEDEKEFNTQFAFAHSFRDSMGSGQVGSLACPHDPIVASYGTIPYPVFVGMRASQ